MSVGAGIIDSFRARSGELSFLDRLDLVRSRLIAAIVVVIITSGIGFYLALNYDVLGVLTAPIEPFLGGERLKYLSPTVPFFLTLKLGICIGLALALPYLLAQVWAIIAPLLRPEEKRLVAPAMIGAVVLFAVGAVFAYLTVVPLMLRFTMGFQTGSLEQSIVIGEYLKLVLRMLAVFGLAFELPVVILVGTVLGIVKPEFLVTYRRHAIAFFVVSGAIITPPDVTSLILLTVPECLLYEISIVLSKAVVARRASPAVADV